MLSTSKSNKSSFRLDVDMISLRALVAIADTGSFSAAAARIGRTQSAVSLHISKLEDRLQVKLLERTSRKVSQTAAGELMISYARRILAMADEAAMALTAPETSTTFRIGFAEYLAPQHLHDLLGRFRRAHPKVPLKLKLGTGSALRACLDKDELDVVISGPDGKAKNRITGTILKEEAMVWVAAPDQHIDFEEPLPLVAMQAPCTYRQTAIDALSEAAIPWTVVTETNSIQGVQSAVMAHLGISAMPASAVPKQGVQVMDNKCLPPLKDTKIAAFTQKQKHPLADRFINFMQAGLGADEQVA